MRPFKFKDGLAAEKKHIGKYIYCNKIQWIKGQQQILSQHVYTFLVYLWINKTISKEGKQRKKEESTININWS